MRDLSISDSNFLSGEGNLIRVMSHSLLPGKILIDVGMLIWEKGWG